MFLRSKLRTATAVLADGIRRGTASAPKENGGLAYLLYDEFITPEANPLASPRACEPGPGTLTVLDVAEKYSIADGKLVCGTAGTGINGKLYDPTITQLSAGLAFVVQRVYSASAQVTYMVFHSAVGVTDEPGTATNRLWAHAFTSTSYNCGRGPGVGNAVISPGAVGDTGMAFVVSDGRALLLAMRAASSVHLLMVYDLGALGITEAHPAWCPSSATQSPEYTSIAMLDLTAARNANPAGVDWADPYSLALVRDSFTDADGTALTSHTPEKGPQWTVQQGTGEINSGACGDTSGAGLVANIDAGIADVLVEVTFGATPALYSSLVFRRAGANDSWTLQYTGTQLVLYEITGGVATNRGVTTKALAAGDSLVVRAAGSDIRCFHRTAAGVYSALTAYTGTAHQTATVVGFIAPLGAPVDSVTVYPIDITGSLPEGL